MKLNVINFHFIDYCNYSCKYCFVKKENKMLSLDECMKVVDNINDYFLANNISDGRINLVGGEVFIAKYLDELIDYIYKKNIKVSIVTNGFLLNESFIKRNSKKLDMIGISVDSLDNYTNLYIGRCANYACLCDKDLINLCEMIHKYGIKVKINHCMSKFNMYEDISEFIKKVKPDRFKVFQMTVIEGINDRVRPMQLSREEFLKLSKKYEDLGAVIEIDEAMKDSYLMVDSKGDFYVDKEKGVIGNLLENKFSDLVINSGINIKHYILRY